MHFSDIDSAGKKHYDGFNRKNKEKEIEWDIFKDRSREVYYLHGALHIYYDDGKLRKD